MKTNLNEFIEMHIKLTSKLHGIRCALARLIETNYREKGTNGN